MSIVEIIVTLGIVASNAMFAGVLIALHHNQRRLERSTARSLESIYDMFGYQIKANGALDEELEAIDEVERNFAERLCDVENRLVDIELDLEDRDAQ